MGAVAPKRGRSRGWLAAAAGVIFLLVAALGGWFFFGRAPGGAEQNHGVAVATRGPLSPVVEPAAVNAPTPLIDAPKVPIAESQPVSLDTPMPSAPARPGPAPAPPKPEEPLPPAVSGSIPVATLQTLKEAAVFVKVESAAGPSSGSGFVMRVDGETGYVVTNEHVVVPKKDGQPVSQPAVTLVFASGTDKERSARAEVLAVDGEHDLAVLRVQGVKQLPRPITFDRTPGLLETMPVYVFGFPFGQALATNKGNPAITVGRASVSSIRRDEHGRLALVQLDGALNPGNSGGPVVDAEGRLVGVAVATIRGANIGLAIPPDDLREMLTGRVGAVGIYRKVRRPGGAALVGEVWLLNARHGVDKGVPATVAAPEAGGAESPDRIELVVRPHLIDPLNRLRLVQVLYAPAADVPQPPQPEKDGTWAPLPRSRVEKAAVVDGRAPLALGLADARGEYYLQLAYERSDGQAVFTQPRAFRIERAGPEPVARNVPLTPAPRQPPAPPPRRPTTPPAPRPPVPAPKVARLPVPTAEERDRATARIKEQFKEDYAKGLPIEVAALAARLLREAAASPDGPAARFVLYQEAASLAARAADFAAAVRAVDELARAFDVKAAELKADVLERGEAGLPPAGGKTLAGLTVRLAEDTILGTGDAPTALRLLRTAERAATKAQDPTLLSQIQSLARDVEAVRNEQATVGPQLEQLARAADDPAANLALGRYYCFLKGQWDKGLPLLAKGKDERLRLAARVDLAGPAGPVERGKVGDDWWDLAEGEAGLARAQLRLRARDWYLKAAVATTGEVPARLEQRLEEVAKAYPGRPPASPAPAARWAFDGDATDSVGALHGTLHGGAEVVGGRLRLNGKQAHLQTPTLDRDWSEKTLEAWFTLATLDQRGSAVLTLQSDRGMVFDSIVFAEHQPRRWMAGSDFAHRTRDLDIPTEDAGPAQLVHMAIVYGRDNSITLYRNGRLLGGPYTPARSGLQTYRAHDACVLIGMRHKGFFGGLQGAFSGEVDEARLYDRALTAEEVAASFHAFRGGKP